MHYRELKAAWTELTAPGAPFEIEEIEVRGVKLKSFKNALPNVRALTPSSMFAGRMYVGARRAFVRVRGVADFANQRVDVVHLVSGALPRVGGVPRRG